MQPGREFRLNWKTAVNEFNVQVSIYENDFLIGDTDTPEVISLQAGSNPLILSTINNNREKFNTIYSKQAVITFMSDQYDINTFFDGPDNRWLVVITLPDTSVILFKGYLVLNDMQQAFMPDPVEVSLTATDHLGILKDIPFTDALGLIPTGKYLVGEYIAYCLDLTGLDLQIRSQYNLREVNETSIHYSLAISIDMLTFEDEVGSLEDAYTVLEKILKWSAILTQYKGEWFYKRVDEFTNGGATFLFSANGIYISDSFVSYDQNIGRQTVHKWCNADQILGSDRPHKFVKLTFNYNLPKEIPCNIDLERGDYQSDIDSDSKKYDLDCWTLYEDRPLVSSTSSTAFIQREFNSFGTEVERFAVIDVASALIEQILLSSFIEVQEKDRFDFSCEVKHDGQIETASGFMRVSYAQIHLFAHDGTYYTLRGGSSVNIAEWQECTSGFDTNQRFFVWEGDGADDHTQWKTVTFWTGYECPPIPKDGYIRIAFVHQQKVDEFQLHIGSVRFELYPYVNGSYQKFTGHHNKVTTDTTGILANKDEEVFISELPHPVYKGSLFKYDSGLSRHILADQFFDYSKDPTATDPHSFGWWQSFDVWNHYKQGNRMLEGSIIGLNDTNPPDVIHQYIILSADGSIIPNLQPRTYMCVGFEQDWKTEIWKGTFIECFNESAGREYASPYEFKYLTNG